MVKSGAIKDKNSILSCLKLGNCFIQFPDAVPWLVLGDWRLGGLSLLKSCRSSLLGLAFQSNGWKHFVWLVGGGDLKCWYGNCWILDSNRKSIDEVQEKHGLFERIVDSPPLWAQKQQRYGFRGCLHYMHCKIQSGKSKFWTRESVIQPYTWFKCTR